MRGRSWGKGRPRVYVSGTRGDAQVGMELKFRKSLSCLVGRQRDNWIFKRSSSSMHICLRDVTSCKLTLRVIIIVTWHWRDKIKNISGKDLKFKPHHSPWNLIYYKKRYRRFCFQSIFSSAHPSTCSQSTPAPLVVSVLICSAPSPEVSYIDNQGLLGPFLWLNLPD